MPNRQMIGGELYRYAFQGQEKDPETGKEAFQLRLWDGRIGRWLTTDPAREFASPYVGMGNNPINFIDKRGDTISPVIGLDEITLNFKNKAYNTVVGWGNVLDRTWNWFKGTEPEFTEEYENRFANSFKDAWKVGEARKYFYSELNRARDLGSDPITNYSGKFGLEGLQKAGLDPYEQFVGSYSITEIKLVTSGDVMQIQYTLLNSTHAKSLTYGAGTSWENGPMGTVTQEIIFMEKINYNQLNNRAKGVINHYRVNNFVTPLR